MSDSSYANRALRRLAVWALSATAIVSIAVAAVPGIPFTEDFVNTNLRDAAETTADWGETTPGILQLGSLVAIESVGIAGATMGDGFDGPHRSRGIALGDFDNDGDLDAAVANNTNEINLVYENDAGGFTTPPMDLGTAARNSLSIDVGDIDLDGDLDIVIGNFQNANVYHLNDGSGNFGDAVQIAVNSGTTWPIRLVDIDGDGDLDVIEGQDGDRVNRIFRNSRANNSNLAFTMEEIGTDTFSTRSMVFGDINGDGFVDMITGDHDADNHIYRGDGNGGFDASELVQPSQAWSTFSLALADLNGDGAPDLIEGSQRDDNDLNGETRIYMNNLAGGFNAPILLPGSNTLHTTVALLALDFDRDGDIDIVEGNNGGWDHDNDGNTPNVAQPNRLYLNDGTGVFTMQAELSIAADNEQTYSMAAGDIDGDGVLDFVTGNQTGENAVYSLSGTPSANPAVVQLHGVAESIQVDDGTNASTKFGRIVINPNDISVPALAQMKFFLSNDDGATFLPAPLDRAMEFPTNRVGPIRWRVEMSATSPLAAQLPTLSAITVQLNEAFPSFVGPSEFSGTQGNAIVPVQVNFSDADGDRLSYTLSGLPAQTGLSIDANSGVISGTPNAADIAAAGTPLTVGAYDGVRFRSNVNAGESFTFSVGAGGNQAPVIDTPIGDQSVTEGEAVNMDLSGGFSDPDGNALSFSAAGLPASMAVSAAGLLTGTPLAADVGMHTVTVTASDPSGAFVDDVFTLTVESSNSPPQLDTEIADQTATEDTAVNIDVSGNFSDPDGDVLTFSMTGQPASLSISTDGIITGTPVTADVGTHDITVTVTDPGASTRSDMFTLTVDAVVVPPPPPPPPRNRGGGAAGFLELTTAALLLVGFQIAARRRRKTR